MPAVRHLPHLGFLLWLLQASAWAVEAPPAIEPVSVLPHTDFDLPLYVGGAGDGSHRLFVLEQGGRIYLLHAHDHKRILALDLSGVVLHPQQGYTEQGLLAAAFHPHFATQPYLYLWYCLDSPRRTVLSRWRMDPDNPDRVDATSETRLLEVPQPFENHKGGTLAFGPDGYLYLSLGDGGSHGDPFGNAQNLSVLLGKILRLDVDHEDGALHYAIPSDNPFIGQKDARPEIWAYGLRNVWRMGFDRQTGDLWAGDVGQDKWEEVDLITKGGNFGWNLREGSHPFQPTDSSGGLIDPLIDYGHDIGRSVIGGYVYRGKAYPSLRGWYLYGDYGSGRIWALKADHGHLLRNQEVSNTHLQITSFGEDDDGEVYFTAFDGHIYQLTAP